MSTEEYYHVFETILLAGVLTLIVQGWSKLYIHKDEYKTNWSYLLGAIAFALVVIWKYFISRSFAIYEIIDSPFDFIILVFVPAASLLMGAYIYFPQTYKDMDFKQHLIKNRLWFCQNVIIMLLMIGLNAYLVDTLTLDFIILSSLMIFLMVAFIATGNIRIWEFLLVVGLIVLPYYLLKGSEYYGLPD